MGAIDYSPLGRAIERLKEGLALLAGDPENDIYRDAVIHRFDMAFDKSIRTLQIHLSLTNPETAITFKAFSQSAREKGLFRSASDAWLGFRDARAMSDQAYNDEIAHEIIELIPLFSEEADYLYSALQRRNVIGLE